MNKDPIRIDYSKKFLKQLKKAPLQIQIAFRDRFAIFLKDPFNPILDNHSLIGNYLGKRSINITGDWEPYIQRKQMKKVKTLSFLVF